MGNRDSVSQPVRTMTGRRGSFAAPLTNWGRDWFGQCQSERKSRSSRTVLYFPEVGRPEDAMQVERRLVITSKAYLLGPNRHSWPGWVRNSKNPRRMRYGEQASPMGRTVVAFRPRPETERPGYGRSVGREPSCHPSVIPCVQCGCAARTPRFPPDCPFLCRESAYPIYQIDSCPAESVRFKTERWVNGPMLVNCEIYLSFAGGKVAMQR